MPLNQQINRRSVSLLAVVGLLAGCQTGTPYRDPIARNNNDMRAVVTVYQASGALPVHTLSVADARSQPTLLAAYRTVMQNQAGQPFTASAYTQVRDLSVDGAAGPLPAKLYDPAPGHRAQPIILYFHGGLGVTGSAAEDDAAARALAVGARAMVLSVDYRLAPENRFPAAFDDAAAAYRWLVSRAAGLGADPRRIAVAGEALGGALALNVAVAARAGGLARPVHILLIDPLSGTQDPTSSAIRNTYSAPLDGADVRWSLRHMVDDEHALADPRLDPVNHADLHGLPPVCMVFSEMSPLDSETRVLAAKLEASGNDVRQQLYAGVSYGFFGMGSAVGRAKEAEAYVATDLRGTFDKIGDPPAPRASPAPRRGGRADRHRGHRRPA